MKLETIKKKRDKEQIIKELKALLVITSASRKTARSYIEKAIDYIEKN